MSVCYKLLKALTVILLTTSHVSSQAPELTNTLHSTVSSELVAFSNENITFTCIVRGSNALEWSSDQYIGTGGRRLEFISTDMPRDTQNAGETVAILDRAIQDTVIESRLFIRVQSGITSASVQCQDGGTGAMTSVTFRLAENDTSVTCDKQSVCPGEPVNCACATGSSNTLAWVIDRLEFRSNDPLLTRRSVDAFGILTSKHNDNRIQVLTSNLTVTASTDDTNLLIQCENVDGSTLNAVSIPIGSQSCPTPSMQVTTSGGNDVATASASCTGPIVAAVVVPVIIILVAIVVVAVVIIIVTRYLKKKYYDKEKELEQDYEGKETKLKKKYHDKEKELEQDYEGKETKLQNEYNDKKNVLDIQKKNLDAQERNLDTQKRNLEREYDEKNSNLEIDYCNKKESLEAEYANKISQISAEWNRKLSAQRSELNGQVEALKKKLVARDQTISKLQRENGNPTGK